MGKRYIRKDGSIVWVNLTVSLVRDSLGEPKYFIGLTEDISERKQAEEALREQKKFSENLIQNSTVPTLVIDSSHKVIIWNKACEKLTGVKASELVGTDSPWQVFYKEKRPIMADMVIDGALNDAESFYTIYARSNIISEGLHGERWYENVNGRKRYLVLDAAPIKNSRDELTAVIETLQDFTDWKNAEEALRWESLRVQKELRLANTVQYSLFPLKLPQVPGATLAATTMAAKEVGGDYCDLLITKDDRLGIAIGDVMGKGIPAALFVAMTYAFVRNYAVEIDSPSVMVNRFNRDLFSMLEFKWSVYYLFYGTMIRKPASFYMPTPVTISRWFTVPLLMSTIF